MAIVIRTGLLVLALTAGLFPGVPTSAQDPAAQTLELAPTVLDLSPAVEEMAAEGTAMSAVAQDTLERSGDFDVRQAGNDYILSVASDVLFGFDSAELSQQARASLSDVAEVLAGAKWGTPIPRGPTPTTCHCPRIVHSRWRNSCGRTGLRQSA